VQHGALTTRRVFRRRRQEGKSETEEKLREHKITCEVDATSGNAGMFVSAKIPPKPVFRSSTPWLHRQYRGKEGEASP